VRFVLLETGSLDQADPVVIATAFVALLVVGVVLLLDADSGIQTITGGYACLSAGVFLGVLIEQVREGSR